jgi:DNA-binding LacI/PurR family transcriptional regulator
MHEAGRDVPREVSLVGFDDIPEAQFFTPPLTTVHQDFNEVGRQSLLLLLDEIGAAERSATRVVVPPVLKVRDSTAPPGR